MTTIMTITNQVESKTVSRELNHKIASTKIKINSEEIVVDPALRKSIEDYDTRIRDEIRRCYILKSPCQPLEHNFQRPHSKIKKKRCFQKSWFRTHQWLEYNMSKDASFCF